MNRLYQIFKIFFKVLGLSHRIDDYFRLKEFSQTLSPLHFDSRYATAQEKKTFFNNQLKEIELETHAYCNRQCSFCPNVSIDRRDKTQILPEYVFKRLIDELADIDYNGSIKFHRFNEPLALDIIFDRVEYARKKLPRALLGFHSNGDYVTTGILKRFEGMGMDFLHISLYIDFNLPQREMRAAANQQCRTYLKNHGLNAKAIKTDDNLVKYAIPMDKIEVYIFVPDIKGRGGNDRGGYLKDLQLNEVRRAPCRSPFRGLYIDWTGDVLPCCNLRSDIDSQKSYIMGNVKDSSLQEIFLSDVSNRIRNMLADYSEKQGACRYCGYDLFCNGKRFEKVMLERQRFLKHEDLVYHYKR